MIARHATQRALLTDAQLARGWRLGQYLDCSAVSSNPLRKKLTEAISLTAMRPPLSFPTGTKIDLRNKRILVTGASSGIGEAGAEQLAAAGARVIAVARRGDLLDALVERITAAGGTAEAIPCDLAELDAIDELVETVGAVDILINNAGRSIRRPAAGRGTACIRRRCTTRWWPRR